MDKIKNLLKKPVYKSVKIWHILIAIVVLFSLGEDNEKVSEKAEENTADILGTYQGVAPSYNMKNKFGEEKIINGQKITIPKIDHKFILEEQGKASLQQTSMEDNSRYFYSGTYKIIETDKEWKKVECSVSDGEYSNPTYILKIWPEEHKATCEKSNDPLIKLKKTK